MKIAPRFEPLLFGLLMSLLMSAVMAGVVTVVNTGATPGFAGRWLSAFAFAWPIAFACVSLFVQPVRRVVKVLLLPDLGPRARGRVAAAWKTFKEEPMEQLILNLSQRLQRGVVAWCDFAYRRPLVTLLLLALLFVPLLSQVPKLQRDGSIEGFFKKDDPQLVAYDQFRRQFGQDGQIVIGLEATGSIFAPEFIDRLTALHKELEREVPHLEDISSLVNARDVRGTEESFVVENLLLRRPSTAAEWQAFEHKARSNQVYRDLLLTPDASFTVVMLKPNRYGAAPAPAAAAAATTATATTTASFAEGDLKPGAPGKFLSAQELGVMVEKATAVARKHEAAGFKVYVSGSPVASTTIVRLLGSDMGRYMLLSIGVMLVLITALTRRPTCAFLAALVIALTLFSTFGLMAATGTAIKPPTQVLLSVILVASVCELIHIVTIFYQQIQAGRPKQEALRHTAEHCAMPVFYTSLTTAAGMAAFSTSPLAPVSDLGWFGAIAVLLAMVYTWTVVSVCVRLFRVRPRGKQVSVEKGAYRWTLRLAMFSHRRPWVIVAGAVPVLAVLAVGLTQVKFAHNSLMWLPDQEPVRVATAKLDDKLHGSVGLEIVVDTGVPGGVREKAFLDQVNLAAAELRKLGAQDVVVGKTIAVTDVLKDINQAIHAGDPKHYVVPDAALAKQEFTLFENSSSDDIHDFVDAEYRRTRITARLPWLEASTYNAFIGRVETLFKASFPQAQVAVTGNMALLARTSTHVMSSMADSYLNSLIAIPLMMMLLLASVRLGLLSMVPNVLPIVAVLGIMGFLGMPLDTFSMLAGSIALGLIVDDSVHFFHNYGRYYREHGDVGRAIEATIQTTGRSMVHATVILSAAFAGFALSQMHNVRDFGIVMVLTICLAMLTDLLLSPALLTLMQRYSNARAPQPTPPTTTATPALETQHV